ncbi:MULTISPECIES: colicin E3-like toxin immunity protein [Pseudomonas]|uniref:colicin E3-like toxin immunity protein n=1 Tax=Pseudomonas TaxID=286 RepID=UPI00070D45B7|nr:MULTISPECIES: colicin E3-like toxin immunity protein [Pseudomonas]KQW34676.1 cloacin [Pseudomonas sp. Root401]WHS53997.1 colicin E3-like toxin immunity protein [Pseudomonas brassicacearum]
MGLKVRLRWFDKETEVLVGKEYSKDFGDDSIVLDDLDLPLENNINNGGFDVSTEWAEILQPHFEHALDLSIYDYQVSFDYRDVW